MISNHVHERWANICSPDIRNSGSTASNGEPPKKKNITTKRFTALSNFRHKKAPPAGEAILVKFVGLSKDLIWRVSGDRGHSAVQQEAKKENDDDDDDGDDNDSSLCVQRERDNNSLHNAPTQLYFGATNSPQHSLWHHRHN
jgi:hypothetical protein